MRFTAAALELRGDHSRVVEHQHVARAQQPRQVAYGAVGEGPLALHHQHPRRITGARGPQRDALGRQLEIE